MSAAGIKIPSKTLPLHFSAKEVKKGVAAISVYKDFDPIKSVITTDKIVGGLITGPVVAVEESPPWEPSGTYTVDDSVVLNTVQLTVVETPAQPLVIIGNGPGLSLMPSYKRVAELSKTAAKELSTLEACPAINDIQVHLNQAVELLEEFLKDKI